MSKLNEDVLFLTLEELRNDRKSLYSCLLVDKTWCETTIPILWKNPFKFRLTDNAKNVLFNVILLHLSKESKENLKNQEIDLFTETHRRPLFNYISYCKYLNLHILEKMITIKKLEKPKISIIRNEILRLFINRNTKFAHLVINPHYQLHLIPGVEHCLSELKFLRCNTNTNENILGELSRTSKSIENLEIHFGRHNNNSGIIELIKAQKKLKDVQFICQYTEIEPFHKDLEESLIKHADTVKYLRINWNPITKFLSNLINLINLNLSVDYTRTSHELNWSHLENSYLPVLKTLKAQWVPSKSLASLIENTNGHLAEISIDYSYSNNNQGLIQSIYQNCPNLRYLKFHLIFNNRNISEFEKLLINCQCLNGLVIASYGLIGNPGWDDLLKILIKSSPTGLFKFKFRFGLGLAPKSGLKLFFDGWKGRHPMLLQTIPIDHNSRIEECFDLIEKYKIEGIIKKYDNDFCGFDFDQFEWHKKLID